MKASSRERLTLLLLQNTTPILFVAIFLFFGVQSSQFLQPQNIENIIKQASFIGMAAVGMTFVLLTAGIDLSIGSIMYLAPLVAGQAIRHQGIGVFPALLLAMVVGMLFGAVNGFCIVKLRIAPFITTLATMVGGRGLGTAITKSRSLDFPQPVLNFGRSEVLGIPLPIVVFVVVVAVGHIVLTRTAFGRQVYAVGNDVEAAKKAGIKTDRVLAGVYVISGLCAALSGFILVSQIGRLDAPFGKGDEFDAIAAAVLGGASLFGGVGNAFGAVIGAVLVQMVQNGLVFTNVNLYLQPMIQATVIFLAVFFDSLRGMRLTKLRRRYIRIPTDRTAAQPPRVDSARHGIVSSSGD
ncbi:MAG TPA: ABC transporter permease [Aggregatilinea sp.]|uniref:ABC transporter permease n=1 Tax=Aggregatilinea sp. TaxID=2806333 RepID=UPI002CE7B54B|nr:ABC transporter permease [Aggregatilinea sp.]HML21932.1 ABC transporter permease [Aggregatilinea sp.]